MNPDFLDFRSSTELPRRLNFQLIFARRKNIKEKEFGRYLMV